MADELRESERHEQCASSVDCVRDYQKTFELHGLHTPRQKLKDLLLSAATDTESGIGLTDLRDRSQTISLQSSQSENSSISNAQQRADDANILDYHNSSESYHGRYGKYEHSTSSSPWCGFSNREQECAKQTLMSKILTSDERTLDNDLCEESFFNEPVGSKFESDEEWEMDNSVLDNGSPLKKNDVAKQEFQPIDEKTMVTDQKPHFGNLSCLLVKQHSVTGSSFVQDLTQVMEGSHLVECAIGEAMSKCDEQKFTLIWMKLTSPVTQDSLSLLYSIRASSKKNKDSHIIVVIDKLTNVDLRTKGADDVMVEPVSTDLIRKTCLKHSASSSGCSDIARPNTAMSIIELTGTPESTISTSSKKTDLDLDSSSPSKGSSVSPPRWCRMEHATKEKQRRERIKDSCDQLRVLLPYVKGRKTDMASILEMTVDYLKIVSSALPEDFHSEVIEIMSTGSPPFEGYVGQGLGGMNMALAKKNAKKGNVGSVRSNVDGTAFGHSETNVNKRMTTRALARGGGAIEAENLNSGNSPIVQTSGSSGSIIRLSKGNDKNPLMITTKREYPENTKTVGSNAKRPHITLTTSQSETLSSSTDFFPIRNSAMDHKRDNFIEDVPPNPSPHYGLPFSQHFLGPDLANKRSFPTGQVPLTDSFPHNSQSQLNQQTLRMAGIDRTDSSYGSIYFDSGYYPFPYSNLQDSNNGNYFPPPGTNEYVNPNSILPVTSYTPRATASGRKMDRMSSTACRLPIDNSDSYNNNNTNSNTNTNNSFLNSTSL